MLGIQSQDDIREMIHTRLRRAFYSFLIGSSLIGAAVLSGSDFDTLLNLAQERFGPAAKQRVQNWVAMLKTADGQQTLSQLVSVNDFFNQSIRAADDSVVWGQSDYWATPIETMGRQEGDCEDFSIAKYISLLKLGVPVNQLRLIYVKATIDNRRQAHMVLAYYPSADAEPLILDNLSQDILPASRRRDLTPVFSFNSAGLWVGGERSPAVNKPETRLSRWRDLINRMRAEGIEYN